MNMLGKKLSPILEEIEAALWEYEAKLPNTPPDYTEGALIAATKIFSSILIDFMHKKQKVDAMPQLWCVELANKIGQRIREIVIDSSGIDPHDFYNRSK